MTARQFYCEGCGHTYWTTTPTSDVLAEFAQNYPGETLDDTASTCDACYKKVMEWKAREAAKVTGSTP